jgi:hypothetical protein
MAVAHCDREAPVYMPLGEQSMGWRWIGFSHADLQASMRLLFAR